MQPRAVQLRCPICKKTVTNQDADFPFCSERCRLIDLGKWASGAYAIPATADGEEETIQEKLPDESKDDS